MGAQGTALLDFGAHPGATDVALDVASVGLVSGSLLEAWLVPKATVDHTADEHRLEEVAVAAEFKAADTMTLRGWFTGNNGPASRSNNGHRIYGKWTVGWVWN